MPTAAPEPGPVTEPDTVMEVTPQERALTQLKLIFDSIDADSDHSIDKAELANALKRDPNLGVLIKDAGFNEKYDLLDQLDTNKDGRLVWNEFQQHLEKAAQAEVTETGNVAAADMPAEEKAWIELRKIFSGLDLNSDGAVDRDELEKGLKAAKDLEELIAEAGLNKEYYVLEQLDTNGDSRITWGEFEQHLKGAAKKEVKAVGIVAAALPFEEEPEVNGMVEPAWFGIWCCSASTKQAR